MQRESIMQAGFIDPIVRDGEGGSRTASSLAPRGVEHCLNCDFASVFNSCLSLPHAVSRGPATRDMSLKGCDAGVVGCRHVA